MDAEGLLTETLEEHENRVFGMIFGKRPGNPADD
jgi:hypothetical protein